VVRAFEDAGIPSDRLTAVNREKVEEALDVTELSESAVYEIEESEYVRKAGVDEERKEIQLQGLKNQLALSEIFMPMNYAKKSRNSNSALKLD